MIFARQGLFKRITFWSFLIALNLGFLAAGGAFAYRFKFGTWPDAEALRIERESLLASTSQGKDLVATTSPEGRMLTLHPYVGFNYDPDNQRSIPVPDHKYDLWNFSEAEVNGPAIRRDPRVFVIAIVGGSVAYNLTASSGLALLVEELQNLPGMKDRLITVLTLGLAGAKQPQQLATISYLLALGTPIDMVINLDGYNEIALPPVEHYQNHAFHSYPRGWWLYVSDNALPVVQEKISSIARWVDIRRSSAKFFRTVGFLPASSSLWKVMDASIQVRIDRLAHEAFELKESVSGRSYLRNGPPVGDAGPEQYVSNGLRIWWNSSVQLSRLCSANRIRYYHFLQPNQYAVSKPMSEAERRIAIREDSPYTEFAKSGYPGLIASAESLRSAGVDFADLTGIFQDHPEPVYSDSCCHLTPRGDELLAEAIAKHIRQGWVQDRKPIK